MGPSDHVVSEPHTVHRAGLEVLGDDVESRHQCKEELAALGRFEIEA
jgi:hypothetical protein